VGSHSSFTSNCRGLWIFGLAPDGGTSFQTAPDALSRTETRAIVRSKGGFVGVGVKNGNSSNYDLVAVKVDLNGNVLWDLPLGGSGRDAGNGITAFPDGSLAVGGYTNSSDGDLWFRGRRSRGTVGWIVKIAPDAKSVQRIRRSPVAE
jgi:hypothetical protein